MMANLTLSRLPILQPMSDALALDSADCAVKEGTWSDGACWLDEQYQSLAVAGLAAVADFNARNGSYVLEFASDDVVSCGVQLDASVVDSGRTGSTALKSVVEAIFEPSAALSAAAVAGVVGPSRSASSEPTASVTGTMDIMQVSFWATSTDLDDTNLYPRFARTIPTDGASAQALCRLWTEEIAYDQVAVLYINDAYGTAYRNAYDEACASMNVSVASFNFLPGDANSIDENVANLAASGHRIVLAVLLSGDLQLVLEAAMTHGLLGSTSVPSLWVFADGVLESNFAALSSDAAAAVHGSLRIASVGATDDNPRYASFVERGWGRLRTADFNPQLPPQWQLAADYFERFDARGSSYLREGGAYEYDAVAAIALLACAVADPSGALPADVGTRMWEAMPSLRFSGLTGTVRFDAVGNRDVDTSNLELQTVVCTGEGGGSSCALAHRALLQGGESAWAWAEGTGAYTGVFTGGRSEPPADAVVSDSDGLSRTQVIVAALFAALLGSGALVCAVLGARRAVRRVRKARRLFLEAEEARQQRIVDATTRLSTLSYPMCFVPFARFRTRGALTTHEAARDAGDLVVMDTFEHLRPFLSRSPTVFISHQWLGASEPDPQGTHYRAICAAVLQLCAQFGLHEEAVHLWLDYASIPQSNRTLQALSISTLSVYASVCRYFVVVAPTATHAHTGLGCGPASYARRGWCRLEQMARMAVGGLKHMYLYHGEGERLKDIADHQEWYHDAIYVMDGDFTVVSDKHKLVDCLLGLWACMLIELRQGKTYRRAPTRHGSFINMRKSFVHGSSGDAPAHGHAHGADAAPTVATLVAQLPRNALPRLVYENRATVFPEEFFGDLIEKLERMQQVGHQMEAASATAMATAEPQLTLRPSACDLVDEEPSYLREASQCRKIAAAVKTMERSQDAPNLGAEPSRSSRSGKLSRSSSRRPSLGSVAKFSRPSLHRGSGSKSENSCKRGLGESSSVPSLERGCSSASEASSPCSRSSVKRGSIDIDPIPMTIDESVEGDAQPGQPSKTEVVASEAASAAMGVPPLAEDSRPWEDRSNSMIESTEIVSHAEV